MTLILKHVDIDKVDDIVDKFNNKYNRTIKIKAVDINSSTYIDFDVENNNKDPKFQVSNHARLSK